MKLILETEKESFDKIVRDQAPIICAKLNYTYEKKIIITYKNMKETKNIYKK